MPTILHTHVIWLPDGCRVKHLEQPAAIGSLKSVHKLNEVQKP
jgi:hypothetical protein